MITFMLPIFYLPHKNPTLFTLLIPEDSRYPSKLGREDTRAKLQKQAKLCWWLRTLCSKAVSDLFSLEPESILQAPGASLDSSQLQAHPHPKIRSACLCAHLPPAADSCRLLQLYLTSRMCWRRNKLLLLTLSSGSLSLLTWSLLIFLTQPTLQGIPGIKGIFPNSGSSQII